MASRVTLGANATCDPGGGNPADTDARGAAVLSPILVTALGHEDLGLIDIAPACEISSQARLRCNTHHPFCGKGSPVRICGNAGSKARVMDAFDAARV